MSALEVHRKAILNCSFCPKLCRFACPVAEAEAREKYGWTDEDAPASGEAMAAGQPDIVDDITLVRSMKTESVDHEAALRHAGWHLTQQNAQKRLVLLVTDGEPADIDERDPQYLRHDAKKAVEDLAMQGIYTYCLTLDPNADRYVARIFGENNYSIVDNVERLPERLPNVFAALTG